jgi:hypothetical protein
MRRFPVIEVAERPKRAFSSIVHAISLMVVRTANGREAVFRTLTRGATALGRRDSVPSSHCRVSASGHRTCISVQSWAHEGSA